MPLSRRKILVLLLTPVALILALGSYVGYVIFVQKYYVVARLEAGSGHTIRILADYFYDDGQAFYYSVETDNRTVVPRYFIGAGEDDGTMIFSLVYSKDRNLVAVTEGSNPNIVYALHDFDSGETWPGSDRFSARGSQIGTRLRDRLRNNTGNHNLILSDDVQSSVPRKLW